MAAPRLTAKIGHKTRKGTTVTRDTYIAASADYAGLVIIRENNVQYVKRAIFDAVIAGLEEIGQVAEGAAKRLCPVDTGRLRNSITHAFVDDHTIVIGTNVEYAPYVHEGTASGRKGNPFLYRAASNNEKRFNAIMRKHLSGGK